MNRIRLSLWSVALALLTGGAGANQAMQEHIDRLAAEHNAKIDNERRQVVCEMVTKVGSRIRQPQCRTKAQIDNDEDEALRFAKKPKLSSKSN
jgi:hypothetical protein